MTKFIKFQEWNTGGRHAPGTADVSLMIRGLQGKEPRVLVNGAFVGRLLPNDKQWVTASVHFVGDVLNNGDNTLEARTSRVERGAIQVNHVPFQAGRLSEIL